MTIKPRKRKKLLYRELVEITLTLRRRIRLLDQEAGILTEIANRLFLAEDPGAAEQEMRNLINELWCKNGNPSPSPPPATPPEASNDSQPTTTQL